VPVGPQWASNLLGAGWGLTRGTFDTSAQAVSSVDDPSNTGIVLRGLTTLYPSMFSQSVGGGPVIDGKALCPVYLCLRGAGAPYQRPSLLQQVSEPDKWHNFQVRDGSTFADGGTPVPIQNDSSPDYWFRLQTPVVMPDNGQPWVLWAANQAFWHAPYRPGPTSPHPPDMP
jgi:hypothetical protein